MAYAPSVLRRAKERLAQEKAALEADYAARLDAAYEKYPQLRELDAKLRTTAAQIVAASFRSAGDPQQAIAAIREQNQKLQRQREWILSDYDEALIEPAPICPICGGSGYVGSKMCECLRELCRQEQKKELTTLLGSAADSFDQVRLDVYPDAIDPSYDINARQTMQRVVQKCRRYAQTFSPGAGSLLMTGAPGLGKTMLSGCIARTVSDRGFSVVYDTAMHIFADYEAAKFGENTEENQSRTQKYERCDLLILDDLGTEMTTQFVISALYSIVNGRLLDRKPVILSTNLSPEELPGRYGAQISSRILGTYQVLQFIGRDIRMMGK